MLPPTTYRSTTTLPSHQEQVSGFLQDPYLLPFYHDVRLICIFLTSDIHWNIFCIIQSLPVYFQLFFIFLLRCSTLSSYMLHIATWASRSTRCLPASVCTSYNTWTAKRFSLIFSWVCPVGDHKQEERKFRVFIPKSFPHSHRSASHLCRL